MGEGRGNVDAADDEQSQTGCLMPAAEQATGG